MENNKTRFCMALPTVLYNRLQEDSVRYGIPKAGIVSMLLVDYYKANDSVTLPKAETHDT